MATVTEDIPEIAKMADYRGSFKETEDQRIEALEVYKGCRRPYDEVAGEDCAAKLDNRHLIGGDQSTRAKQKTPVPPKNARVVPGGRSRIRCRVDLLLADHPHRWSAARAGPVLVPGAWYQRR
ncbi:hypothetical protein [Streptomyces sp. NPDC052012]|uniref:hypothetical protein n=1 Tax=Streptomyces sp. NPDC052012 TaxID=3155051 RepID=UPI0034506CED